MRWTPLVCASLVMVGCRREPGESDGPGEPDPRPAPRATQPLRGAAGDDDLRVMLAELASSKACAMMKGQFRPLRAPDRHDTVTGVLWIRDCQIANHGTRVTFRLAGNGWQWAEQTKKKAGGTFVVRQYVRFGVEVELPGSIDLAYDDATHVASLWFSPAADPAIEFAPVGGVEVDRKGLWSSVIGGISSLFASSPERQAEHQARREGTRQFEHELADGMALTIDLCTGLSRFNLGRPPRGAMQAPDAGESHAVPVELSPGGLLAFGPQLAPDGMTIQVAARRGGVRIALACADKAEQAAQAFLDGDLATIPELASADVRTTRRLHVPAQRCPVVVLARSLDDAAPVVFDWQRPPGEAARSTGGPLIRCARPPARR
ncbi:MAG TPA: hypothetical protein VFT22_02925 [Kofleriaceae bacterium]|nr:hypothetical protein [Kofleriaceae bacterium]